jgi:malonyl CoA-acyl carrier protein transacylase
MTAHTIFYANAANDHKTLLDQAYQSLQFILKLPPDKQKFWLELCASIAGQGSYRLFFPLKSETNNLKIIQDHINYIEKTNVTMSNVVFLFPGQGLEYEGVGYSFYHNFAIFKNVVDSCLQYIPEPLAERISNLIISGKFVSFTHDICLSSLVIFIIEYALAALLFSFGITPKALFGYSVGEYVAAVVSEIFSLEDAVRLLLIRGNLMNSLPDGRMISVALPIKDLSQILKHIPISIAADHGDSCIISGNLSHTDQAKKALDDARIFYQPLKISKAGHSYMLDHVLNEYHNAFKDIKISSPKIPIVSSVTAGWFTKKHRQSSYWVGELRKTVQFDLSIEFLLKNNFNVFLETGIGTVLTVLVNQKKISYGNSLVAISTGKDPSQTDVDESQYFLSQLARLWYKGMDIIWHNAYMDFSFGSDIQYLQKMAFCYKSLLHRSFELLPLEYAKRKYRERYVDYNAILLYDGMLIKVFKDQVIKYDYTVSDFRSNHYHLSKNNPIDFIITNDKATKHICLENIGEIIIAAYVYFCKGDINRLVFCYHTCFELLNILKGLEISLRLVIFVNVKSSKFLSYNGSATLLYWLIQRHKRIQIGLVCGYKEGMVNNNIYVDLMNVMKSYSDEKIFFYDLRECSCHVARTKMLTTIF